jgi:hypothetical protein
VRGDNLAGHVGGLMTLTAQWLTPWRLRSRRAATANRIRPTCGASSQICEQIRAFFTSAAGSGTFTPRNTAQGGMARKQNDPPGGGPLSRHKAEKSQGVATARFPANRIGSKSEKRFFRQR